MAAAPSPEGGTKSGVQADSSVALLIKPVSSVLSRAYSRRCWFSLVVVGRRFAAR